jgi:hypothetical protein
MWASRWDRVEVVQQLIAAHADVHALDKVSM